MSTENDISQELFETIEGYLNGSLPDSERMEFERQLENDPTLQQNVEDIKTLLIGVESAVLQDRMESFHEELPKDRPQAPEPQVQRSRRNWYYGFGIAASIALAAALYFTPLGDDPNQSLFENYFEPDPGLPTTMGSTNDFDFYEAMVDYKKGDYTMAITKWEALPEGTKGDTLTYFLGMAHLANRNETKAISYLEPLSQKTNPAFANETRYYLGLAYLKQDDVANAKKELAASGTEGALKILAELND
ncbi:hypothetical protein POV27_02690 [Aureisphaera galaxeae]|uniref:hypothetical protein n=1 Tax=Aureisphaera galaxeae TaxID=1538023 RepID=UPI00234FC2A8|nr:hypothetical protein [Aureisphaera galaxeae]MDC8002939.1 hypothetical protein [Aureisphaera galaxeae]